MDYQFAVYGDSIAFGYGNSGISWFDYLSDRVHSLKLAQNGEKIADVLNKIKSDNNHYSNLIIAVGINDLLQDTQNLSTLNISKLIKQYEQILKVASVISGNVIVQSVLPVREDLFPAQEWLDCDKWAFNENICKFNNALSELSKEYSAIYVEAYTVFSGLHLEDIYCDAVHLNDVGQRKLFEIYNCLARKL